MSEQKNVSIKEVLSLLDKGYVRHKQSDKGTGSIEEYYGLTPRDKKELFEHPKVKAHGRRKNSKINIIDDTDDIELNVTQDEIVVVNTMLNEDAQRNELELSMAQKGEFEEVV